MEAVRRVALHGSLTIKVYEATGEVTAPIGETSSRMLAPTRRLLVFQAALGVSLLRSCCSMLLYL